MSEVKENILATLAYFDMFNYPLTRAEVYVFLKKKHPYDEFEHALRCLTANSAIHQFDRFYTLKKDHYPIIRRNDGNKKAAELIKVAEKVGNILIRFPYVRGIAISGSLSKNFADEFSDIDLFIITAKNRLWVARTIMHCFKKLTYLMNKEHYFCMNYYVDEQQLEIAEKNIYTAIEIGTLIPLQGDLVFEQFYMENAWTRNFLPNKNMRVATAKPVKTAFFKRVIEFLLFNRIGNAIDNMLMKITSGRWAKKTRDKMQNSHGLIMGMATGKHFSKPDPKNFQHKLLAKYENKVFDILRENENSLAL
ncbi:nucleotidyltransferase domain-containing protein [Mucilaginibacter sp.]|uniref:nucleotidyltransferase domain-containing protein n=1 Tax=Mucilaginibacter sp. TaxID=1882438 RepID=UPI00284448F0|nr:nucleotidyltransferase domain-containing protein [Mucilaginibacter sp.]MDR3696838.1 nucleotidyltransferase domain-containing protein [Mucilaginibacter sp.]